MSLARQVWAVARKDVRAEWRTKESLNSALSFSVAILLLVSFVFEPSAETTREMAGGLLWLVFAIAAVLVLNRTFARELPNDCLDALVCAPLSGTALFLGKALGSFAVLLLVEGVSLPVFSVFYNIPWMHQAGPLALVLLLGTWAVSVVGTMFSALTVNLRLREVMLPMLLYPVLIPALLGAMELTNELLANRALAGDVLLWLRLLVAFDVVYTATAVMLIDAVLVE